MRPLMRTSGCENSCASDGTYIGNIKSSIGRSVETLMSSHTYPAATIVAPKLHEHFSRHLEAARRTSHQPLASLPSVETISILIDAAFWASLRHEEGYVSKISMAY